VVEAERAAPAASRGVNSVIRGTAPGWPALTRAAFFVLLVAWTFVAGKDVSWDVLNHQLYLPFAWLNGRARTDYFAAGPQAYQNALGYFPLYGLVRAGLPAWSIGVVLGAAHALVVWPLDSIARLFWGDASREDLWLRALALALSCIAPIFLIHAGSTSIDPFASLAVLWALALSLESPTAGRRDRSSAALAGALLGLASAMKLSNAVFAVALCGLWLLKWLVGQADLRRLAAFAAGMALAFGLFAGPWIFWLWHDFGNPIFPLFNHLFHSPYAPQQAAVALRFVPDTAIGALTRLGELAELSKFVSFEAFVPDIRPALVAIAALAAAALIAAQGGWRRVATLDAWRSPGVQLALSLTAMYFLWIRTSGNARYGMPMFIVAGIALVRAVQRALPARAVKVVLLTILSLQAAYYFHEGNFRFEAARWDSGPYIEYQVSRRLREEPFLHLAIGTQTNAAAALSFDPRGAMSNPIGQFSLPLDGTAGRPLQALLDRWHGRTRVLLTVPPASKSDDTEQIRDGVHAMLYRLGLDVDWHDCESVPLKIDRSPLGPMTRDGVEVTDPDANLKSCAVLYTPMRDPVVEREHADADRVFALMEAACPNVFAPQPFVSEHGPGVWQRHYINTDAVLFVSAANGVHFAHFRSINGANFGSVEDVLARRVPITCPQISYQTPK
jgi:hypothetical protein